MVSRVQLYEDKNCQDKIVPKTSCFDYDNIDIEIEMDVYNNQFGSAWCCEYREFWDVFNGHDGIEEAIWVRWCIEDINESTMYYYGCSPLIFMDDEYAYQFEVSFLYMFDESYKHYFFKVDLESQMIYFLGAF